MGKKILIIRLSAMGDVIFIIPLANILKSNGYKVSWLVGDKGIDLLRGNPAVDDIIYLSEKEIEKQNIFRKISAYFKTIKYIRAQKFDIAIDTQGLLKTLFWTRFCGAKRRIVSKSAREGAVFGGNEIIEELNTNWNSHVTQDYLKFSKHLGLNTDEIKITLPATSEQTKAKVDKLLANVNTSKPLMVAAPSTTWLPKCWNIENWKNLVKKLEGKFSIVFTGLESDINLIDYIISGGSGINLAGKTDISDICEIYKRADIVVSLDSGSTHLAWATQSPKIVSIFCCTPKSRYAPLGSKDKYISLQGNLQCQPCHKKNCHLGNHACTNFPTVDEVYNAIIKLTSK